MVTQVAKLQLFRGTWYAWEMLPGYTSESFEPYFSPILIQEIVPKKTGQGILAIKFINLFYADGVKDFSLDLKVSKHEAQYLIADILYSKGGPRDRAAIISRLEFEWIRRFGPHLWWHRPPSRRRRPLRTICTRYTTN